MISRYQNYHYLWNGRSTSGKLKARGNTNKYLHCQTEHQTQIGSSGSNQISRYQNYHKLKNHRIGHLAWPDGNWPEYLSPTLKIVELANSAKLAVRYMPIGQFVEFANSVSYRALMPPLFFLGGVLVFVSFTFVFLFSTSQRCYFFCFVFICILFLYFSAAFLFLPAFYLAIHQIRIFF